MRQDWTTIVRVGEHRCHLPRDRRLFHLEFRASGRTWSKPDSRLRPQDPRFCGPPEPLEVFCPVGALTNENRCAVVRRGDLVELWSREE